MLLPGWNSSLWIGWEHMERKTLWFCYMGGIQHLTLLHRKQLLLYKLGYGEGITCSPASQLLVLRNTKEWTSTPANKMPKQPSWMYRGKENTRNFSGEMGFHGNCSHVSWAKWGPCRRLQKKLNLSSQLETEATGKRYSLLRKPELMLAFPVSPYNNKLLLQSQVLPGMAHYPYNKTKPKEQIRKLTGLALWRNNYCELLCTDKLPPNKID